MKFALVMEENMHPRFIRELSIMAAAVLGAVIGYAAGARFSEEWHMVCAFVGMGLGGGFADFCLRGGK